MVKNGGHGIFAFQLLTMILFVSVFSLSTEGARAGGGVEKKECGCPDWMVPVSSGKYLMGSAEDEEGRDEDEGPVGEITVNSFCIGESEVTQSMWNEVMGYNPSYFSDCGGDCPVERISFFDAVEFCNRLSVKEGLTACYKIAGRSVSWNRAADGYRLPTETEWEYACRAGATTAYNTGGEVADLLRAGWFRDNSAKSTHPVRRKEANAWGLYDMHGNVYEWCWDRYADYSTAGSTEQTGSELDHTRVVRGGAWYRYAKVCRSASRCGSLPSYRGFNLGFRLVRSH